MKGIAMAVSFVSYAVCLAAPLFYFYGRMDPDTYKTLFAAGTLGFLIFATVWASRMETGSASDARDQK